MLETIERITVEQRGKWDLLENMLLQAVDCKHEEIRTEVRAERSYFDAEEATILAQHKLKHLKKQVADLQALREKERVLAGRAVADVKALRAEVAKKNALGMQALQEMKKLQLQLAQRDAELQGAAASRSELGAEVHSWKSKAEMEEAERKRRIEHDMDVDEGTELAWLLAREAGGAAAAARPAPRGQAGASDSRKRGAREETREWERRRV